MSKKDNQGGSSVSKIIVGGLGVLAGFALAKLFSNEEEKQPAPKPVYNNPINEPNCVVSDNSTTETATDDSLDHFICPITLVIMNDPYISKKCGHSFEKSAIQDWLAHKNVCPKCNTPLSNDDLIRNINLKNAIDHMKESQKV